MTKFLLGSRIETLSHPFGANRVYLGLGNGTVQVLNLEKNYVASYQITLEDVGLGRMATR